MASTTDEAGSRSAAGEFDRLLAHTPLALVECDAAAGIVRWDGGAERMFGWSRKEVIGRTIDDLDLRDPSGIENCDASRDQLDRGEQAAVATQCRNRTKSGEWIECEWYSWRVTGPDGSEPRFLSVVLDVSGRERAREHLRATEGCYQRMVETAREGIWIIDAEGRTTFVNESMAVMLATTAEEMRGRSFLDYMDPEDRADAAGRLAARREGAFETHDFKFRRRDGAALWAMVSSSPTLDEEGRTTAFLGMLTDITDRKRAEDALAEANATKDRLLSNIIREVRTPLVPLSNALEILRNSDPDDVRFAWAIGLIEREISSLHRLLDDVGDATTLAGGRIALRCAPIPVASVIRRAVEECRPRFDVRYQSLFVDLPEKDVVVEADAGRLGQVVRNLLDNASRYSGEGQSVRLRMEPGSDGVTISVKDEGVGIAPMRLSRVFEPFGRPGSPAIARGMGVGLALVKGLVDAHGGRVEARSLGTGHGSEFLVWLPLRQEASPKADLPARRPPLAKVEPARVLVADAYSPSAESLAILLRLQGHVVRVSRDGNAALAAVDDFRPDLVILDVAPSGLRSLEVARMIRSRTGGDRIVIVAATNPREDVAPGFVARAGFDLQVRKPIVREDLETAFELVGERRVREAAGSVSGRQPVSLADRRKR